MNFDPADLKDLEVLIGDQLFIQVASWHLYLGDAGLAKAVAIECIAKIEEGPAIAAQKALESIQVSLAGGESSLPLCQLIPPDQVVDLSNLLDPYCR